MGNPNIIGRLSSALGKHKSKLAVSSFALLSSMSVANNGCVNKALDTSDGENISATTQPLGLYGPDAPVAGLDSTYLSISGPQIVGQNIVAFATRKVGSNYDVEKVILDGNGNLLSVSPVPGLDNPNKNEAEATICDANGTEVCYANFTTGYVERCPFDGTNIDTQSCATLGGSITPQSGFVFNPVYLPSVDKICVTSDAQVQFPNTSFWCSGTPEGTGWNWQRYQGCEHGSVYSFGIADGQIVVSTNLDPAGGINQGPGDFQVKDFDGTADCTGQWNDIGNFVTGQYNTGADEYNPTPAGPLFLFGRAGSGVHVSVNPNWMGGNSSSTSTTSTTSSGSSGPSTSASSGTGGAGGQGGESSTGAGGNGGEAGTDCTEVPFGMGSFDEVKNIVFVDCSDTGFTVTVKAPTTYTNSHGGTADIYEVLTVADPNRRFVTYNQDLEKDTMVLSWGSSLAVISGQNEDVDKKWTATKAFGIQLGYDGSHADFGIPKDASLNSAESLASGKPRVMYVETLDGQVTLHDKLGNPLPFIVQGLENTAENQGVLPSGSRRYFLLDPETGEITDNVGSDDPTKYALQDTVPPVKIEEPATDDSTWCLCSAPGANQANGSSGLTLLALGATLLARRKNS